MRWYEVDISFGTEDHPMTELPNQNLPFVIKLRIRQHKVAKTFMTSLNLIMRKIFIKIGLNLAELTLVHDSNIDIR
jgi:hypothetical protein